MPPVNFSLISSCGDSRDPTLELTRNRKPLEQPAPFGTTWELRFGANNRFRVLYEVDAAEQVILVLAIGGKDREKLIIGGEEIEI
jgi:mRNA-degrading endonuclease RelE of RelBE toxin-antitoxin system